jgi:hypothetical protein
MPSSHQLLRKKSTHLPRRLIYKTTPNYKEHSWAFKSICIYPSKNICIFACVHEIIHWCMYICTYLRGEAIGDVRNRVCSLKRRAFWGVCKKLKWVFFFSSFCYGWSWGWNWFGAFVATGAEALGEKKK